MRFFSTDSQNLKIKTDMPLVRALTARGTKLTMVQDGFHTVCVPA